MHIGIVDSGFRPAQGARVAAARGFWLGGDGQLQEGAATPDRLGHGSAVLDAVAAQAGAAELHVAQVFHSGWSTSALQIAAALYWLIGQRVGLINLSLGVRLDRPLLREACAAALQAGIVLCGASPAQGAPVYPASYPGVLRITGDARCRPGQWSWLASAQADFGTAVPGATGLAGASIATAAMSGLIVAWLERHPGATCAELLAHLQQAAHFTGPERKGASA